MEHVAPISTTAPDSGYSLENARALGWNSVSGDLTRIYQRRFTFLALRSSSSPLYENLAAVIDLEPVRAEAPCALA